MSSLLCTDAFLDTSNVAFPMSDAVYATASQELDFSGPASSWSNSGHNAAMQVSNVP